MRRAAILLVLLISVLSALVPSARAATPQHGLALHGDLKYGPDFKHLDYVNPDAPKGGEMRLSFVGSFDSLNPFILRGIAAPGVAGIFLPLLESTLDEPFSEYGQIAESVSVAEDRKSATFRLRPVARFSDGTPVTAEDVRWSFETLKSKGQPFYRSYYAAVERVDVVDPRTLTFHFSDTSNAELPLIVGQLPVLPSHWFKGKDFTQTFLTPPPGSGPYRIASVTPGSSIVYERIADWWGKDLPLNRGRFNYDRIRYDAFRDPGVQLEGFFAGQQDFRLENIAKNWATGYDVPPVQKKLIVRDEIPNALPAGMQAFIFNLRRPLFADERVREALSYAFDFEWSNKNLAFGAYKRTASYFENSELAARGLPSPAELAILEPYRAQLPAALFTEPFVPPRTDGSGNNRTNLRTADRLLTEAGWILRNGKRVNAQSGAPFTFTIMDESPAFDRWVQPFLRNLEKLGIEANFQIVDPSLYQSRLDAFDFDMTIDVIGQSLSPGNEQREYWSSKRADVKGSRNRMGLKNPVVDALVEQLVQAKDRADLVQHVRALDRVLLWGHYVIPQWYAGSFRIAYWDKLGKPAVQPPYGLTVLDAWWVDPAKAAKIAASQRRAE